MAHIAHAPCYTFTRGFLTTPAAGSLEGIRHDVYDTKWDLDVFYRCAPQGSVAFLNHSLQVFLHIMM